MTWTLERFQDKPPATTNKLLKTGSGAKIAHRGNGNHAIIAQWREWAAKQYAELGWEPYDGQVSVTYRALRVRHGRLDVGATYVLGKAMLDGLVEAGFLPDDNDETVVAEHLLPQVVVGRYGIRLVIRELEIHRGRTTTVHTPAGGVTLSGTPLVDGT